MGHLIVVVMELEVVAMVSGSAREGGGVAVGIESGVKVVMID